jgi:hypothetical protein
LAPKSTNKTIDLKLKKLHTKNMKKIIPLIIGLLFLSGCTTKFAMDVEVPGQEVVVHQEADQLSISSLQELGSTLNIVSQRFTKKDWLIVVFYDFNLEISSLSQIPEAEGTNLKFTTTLPGKITHNNGEKIDKNTVSWDLNKTNQMSASSRDIRWWQTLLILFGLFVIWLSFMKKSGGI